MKTTQKIYPKPTTVKSTRVNYKYALAVTVVMLATLFGFMVQKPAQAENSSENSDQINTLERVQNIWLVDGTKSKLNITWGKISNADQYQIRILDENLTIIEELTANKNHTTIDELTEQTQYFAQVRAVNVAEEIYGEWSKRKEFHTKPYQEIKDFPIGINYDSLPPDVRMYPTPQQAYEAGAMKIALGDLYTDLLEYVQQYSASQQSLALQDEERRLTSEKLTWLSALANRAREKAKEDAAEQGGAHSTNDPHMLTFDGLTYDNQARGIFWLVKDSQNEFSVQALQRYMKDSSNVAYNSAVAVVTGGHTLTFNLENKNLITLDESSLNITGNRTVVWPGALLMRHKNQFLLITEEDQNFLLKLESMLNPEVTLNKTLVERYAGLFGNANNTPYDDLSVDTAVAGIDEAGEEEKVATLADFMTEESTAYQMSAETFYETYIEPWATTEEISFFAENDYIGYLPPVELMSLDDFTREDIQTTRNECLSAAGVEASSSLFGCVYDHLAGGVAVAELAPVMKRLDGKIEPTAWVDLQ